MIAVTTLSRAKGLRYTLPIFLAGRRIGRELRDAPGCQRYTSVIAGQREFWTLTIWRDASEMRKCMRGGTHGRVMWTQPYWLECYWGMQWRPGRHQSGEWEGDAWQWPDGQVPRQSLPPSPGMLPTLPSWMQAALGRTVPLERRQIAGAAGATYRLRVPPWQVPAALRDLRQLRQVAAADPDFFKPSLGLGTDRALYLLVVATTPGGLERFRTSSGHKCFLQRWGDRLWWSTWEPDCEFGQWESRRLREGQLAGEPPLVDMRLPAQLDAPRRAREALRARLPTVDPASLELLRLLTSELVTNDVRHAGLEPAGSLRLQICAKRDWVRVEVTDHGGRRFEPHVPLCKAPDSESGRGLLIVDQIADRWGVTDRLHEHRVWFELRLPSPVTERHAGPEAY
ncbi:MAG: ATP-binding protein [Acidimicrobiales bacterium]